VESIHAQRLGYPAGSLVYSFLIGIDEWEYPHRTVKVGFDEAGTPLGMTLQGSRIDGDSPRVDGQVFDFRPKPSGVVTLTVAGRNDSAPETTQRDPTTDEIRRAYALAEWLWKRRCGPTR